MSERSISERFAELNLAANKSCKFTLKEKALFMLRDKPLPPPALIDSLGIAKSNLANLMAKMLSEGLIERRVLARDRRQIEYRLTIEGADRINAALKDIEKEFNNFLTTQQEYDTAKEKLESVIDILSFMK